MKAFLILIILGGVVWVASVVVPQDIKDRLSATIGFGNVSVGETITNTAVKTKDKIAEHVIPKSPQEVRAELIERLERSVKEIEEAQEEEFNLDSFESTPETRTQEIIRETERIIIQLKEENEKDEKGAVRSVLQATADALSGIGGSDHDSQESCECGVSE